MAIGILLGNCQNWSSLLAQRSLPESLRVNEKPAPLWGGRVYSASISFWSGMIPGTSHLSHISSILL
ncbi:MAG TPA: hypothetical protein VJX30_18125, partial [Terriglobales bacterium]|nr:hypothetical protein [Terriglobales bacterium]